MPLQTPPASEVLLLVLVAWTAGTAVFAAATRIGGEVDPGHFKVVWIVTTVLGAILGARRPEGWAAAGAAAAAFASIYLRRDRLVGVVAAAVSAWVLVALARPVLFTAAAAVLLGAVTNAMLLGHWHLNQPRLGTGPLRRLVWALWAGLGVFTAAAAVLMARALDRPGASAALVGAVTALAFTVFAGILTAMVAHLVRTRSIMSATGILYLDILLCFVAVFTGSLGALSPALG